jgi:hypothetical protein
MPLTKLPGVHARGRGGRLHRFRIGKQLLVHCSLPSQGHQPGHADSAQRVNSPQVRTLAGTFAMGTLSLRHSFGSGPALSRLLTRLAQAIAARTLARFW